MTFVIPAKRIKQFDFIDLVPIIEDYGNELDEFSHGYKLNAASNDYARVLGTRKARNRTMGDGVVLYTDQGSYTVPDDYQINAIELPGE